MPGTREERLAILRRNNSPSRVLPPGVRDKLSAGASADETVDERAAGMRQRAQDLISRSRAETIPVRNFSAAVGPTLEAGGAILGGAIAGPSAAVVGPAGPAAGGALGFAAGRQLRRRMNERLGLEQAPESFGQGVRQAAGDVGSGVAQEVLGGGINRAIAPVSAGARFVGRGLATLGKATSGVARKSITRLANRPSAFFTPRTRSGAGKALGKVEESLGIPQIRSPNDVIQNLEGKEVFGGLEGKGKKDALLVFNKIKGGAETSLAELRDGIKAVDRFIRKTPIQKSDDLRILNMTRARFSEELGKKSPELAKARSQFADAALASEFRRLLPVTKSGEIDKFSSLLIPALAFKSGNPILATAASPFVVGAAAAGLGGAAKLAGNLRNPVVRRGVSSLGINALERLFNDRRE